MLVAFNNYTSYIFDTDAIAGLRATAGVDPELHVEGKRRVLLD